MTRTIFVSAMLAVLGTAPAVAAPGSERGWRVHDRSRPHPPVVAPPAQHLPAPAPPDATILLNGTDLAEWTGERGEPAKWTVRDGVLTVVPGAGGITSKRSFGDAQVHLEWAAPVPAVGHGQGRGNSGLFLMGLYEVQILDSYHADTYADGQAASIYGQYPPLVNACRPPGEWQSYDVYFRAPRFAADGRLRQPARVTVIHNGLLVQDNVEILGPTVWLHYQPYKVHAARLPLSLQEHGSPVRYRNIWVRDLPETPAVNIQAEPRIGLKGFAPGRYTGAYRAPMGSREEDVTITAKGGRLYLGIPYRGLSLEMVPVSEREFVLRHTDARLVFDLGSSGQAPSFSFSVSGDPAWVARRSK